MSARNNPFALIAIAQGGHGQPFQEGGHVGGAINGCTEQHEEHTPYCEQLSGNRESEHVKSFTPVVDVRWELEWNV